MNKKGFVREITDRLRESNARKPVNIKKHTFTISDEDGNRAEFNVKQQAKEVIYTVDDVNAIIDAALAVLEDLIKNGDQLSIHGYGVIGLKYREPRRTRSMITNDWVDIPGHYTPKFEAGNLLRMAAKIYDMSVIDKLNAPVIPELEDEDEEE